MHFQTCAEANLPIGGEILADDLEAILSRRPEAWQDLRDKSLFITGGTGWFGRWLLEAIALANDRLKTEIRVTLLSRNPAAFARRAPHLAAAPFLTLHTGDVRNFEFPTDSFTHVIHAATTSARETFDGESGLGKFDTLVSGTRHVLDFAIASGARHMLFTSSGVAYGETPDGAPYSEETNSAPDTCNPDTALGQAKRAAEFLCSAYATQHGWQLSIARCFSFVGPFMPMDLHYAIGDFITQAWRREAIVIKGDGTPVRSYLYAADLVVWLLVLLTRQGRPRIYNVGSDAGITLADLARQVRDLLNPGGTVHILGQARYSVGNPVRNRYFPDVSRARQELALDVWTPLAGAIERTAHSLAPVSNQASDPT
jgi:nucleoside-diphosphate-sugar epimerase